MHIKVMADYQCHPLWWDEGSGQFGEIGPKEIGLSGELSDLLQAWAAEFDATLNVADPAQSGFPSVQAGHNFVERGRELAEKVSVELGASATVRYWP